MSARVSGQGGPSTGSPASRATANTSKVPPGATRLYLGIMDGYEWNNNKGAFTVTVYKDDAIGVVR